MLGLVLFAATIVVFRDYRKLERYRYLIVVVSLGLLVLPRLPGLGYQANGAYLGVRIPGLFVFQPAEFAKIGLVIFLASYLRDTRQVMVIGARRVLGVTIPPLKHFGPVLVIWGLAMVILLAAARHRLLADVLRRPAGDAVRRHRAGVSFVVVGLVAVRRSAPGTWARTSRTSTPASRRGCTRSTRTLYNTLGGQLPARQRACSPRRPAGCSARASAQATLTMPGRARSLLPAPQTDMIYAVITDELGLFGAAAVLLTYLLFVARGFKTAMLARDSFSKLLAAGLTRDVRAAGVRDRRRGHAGDPADRRDAAVHLLRRLVDHRQLRAAGAAAARLRPRRGGRHA